MREHVVWRMNLCRWGRRLRGLAAFDRPWGQEQKELARVEVEGVGTTIEEECNVYVLHLSTPHPPRPSVTFVLFFAAHWALGNREDTQSSRIRMWRDYPRKTNRVTSTRLPWVYLRYRRRVSSSQLSPCFLECGEFGGTMT